MTAEQLLRDAKERQASEVKTPKQKIQNSEELAEWRFLQRRRFEEGIKNQRQFMGNYIKYAKWEEKQVGAKMNQLLNRGRLKGRGIFTSVLWTSNPLPILCG